MAHLEARHPNESHSTGPFTFLHPTTRYLRPVTLSRAQQHHDPGSPSPAAAGWTTGASAKDTRQVYHVWRSRDNRKGRQRAVIIMTQPKISSQGKIGKGGGGGDDDAGEDILRPQRVRSTLLGLTRLATRFPVWDVSCLVAVAFLLGLVHRVCINGCFIWLPLVAPQSEFPRETDNAEEILAFIGATIFEVGSWLMVVEATNAERSDCFGWALEASLEDHRRSLRPKHEACRHHHRGWRAPLKDSAVAAMAATAINNVAEPGGLEERKGDDANARSERERRWLWWPTWHEFKTHYTKEIGFLASFVQLLGATIFWISGLTALPPIYNALSVPLVNGVYWVPQVVGGTGFVVSKLLFMVEVQDKWYKPTPERLSWHIGFWNLIGGLGFTLCPAVGFNSKSSPALEYASALSTFIGSWAFLVGSVAQWYESLDKYPVPVEQSPSWLQLGERAV
ncbi:hypothetical protein N657DRAFT_665806 [Parathielavia appendiculata]|uniref:Integral membrane protein n=1 Tax=Parathielavia appendiculata TaxID=2587402 RepID=A0AAN6Z210_9PEZI|nr:hypothetical protein N657DRAFT_665806 [Parathielavia appendiculata]